MAWMKRVFLISSSLFAVFFSAHGQHNSHCKWVPAAIASKGFVVDSLSVLENTIRVLDDKDVQFAFQYAINSNTLKVDIDAERVDSVKICYQTFPFSLHRVYALRTLEDNYDSTFLFRGRGGARPEVIDFRERFFPENNLTKSGSLTRGVSFGNVQNLFVNSSLNLQMEGQLTDGLNIRASISDQNVPFQPEGNTQQLQDFDNVLIELYNDHLSLEAGDVVLRQRESEFLRYRKNVQGLLFTSDYQLKNEWKASTQAGISIAKGKFASIQLPVLEGVSGPYKIQGPQNERFVIIMANSEKAFLDGKPLKRGFNYDYIIDYNQGEITFTSNVIITQYSRIRIDFEYAERNFSRSILTSSHQQQKGAVSFYLNYYQEKDSPNRPLFFEWSEQDKRLLSKAGNDLTAAVVPRIDSVLYDPNRILYKKETWANADGKEEVYYEYSSDPSDALYAISFVQVGAGKGSYRRKKQLANGSVYEYVPAVNGMLQGDYSFYSALPAPNKKQMITLGTKVKLNSFEQIYAEIAFSDTDVNLFSDSSRKENKGLALKAGVSSHRKLTGLKGYHVNSLAEVEYNSSTFSFIDRFRSIEFDRDWNLSHEEVSVDAAEQFVTAQIEVAKNPENSASYGLKVRNKHNVRSGAQQNLSLSQELGPRLILVNDAFLLKSDTQDLKSSWIRYNASLRYRSKIFVPGYSFQLDKHRTNEVGADSVISSAINFFEHQFFVRTNDTLSYSFFGNASWREDKFPTEGKMVPFTKAFTTSYGMNKRFGLHELKGSFTFRELTHLSKKGNKETTLLGRLDYLSSLFDTNLRNEISYAIGNGRELRREYIYLPVPTGDGTHTWRDDNGDNIQQLNEFYLAVNPEEKNFIKIFVPTDDYVLAYTSLLNYRMNAKFPDRWRDQKGLKFVLQKFSNNTMWNVEKKVSSSDFFTRVSPFLRYIADEDLVAVRQTLRSTLFYNRSSPRHGVDVSFYSAQRKQLLSEGFEDLVQKDWKMTTRFNWEQKFNLKFLLHQGRRQSASDFLANRNYLVALYSLGPEITWQPSTYFRSSGNFTYTSKRNLTNAEINEKAFHNQFGLDLRYAKAIKTTINAHLNYTNISYNGETHSPTGYEMLQALTLGGNLIWRVNWVRKIGEGLQFNLTYEGRDSEGLERLIHTGRMQVSALF